MVVFFVSFIIYLYTLFPWTAPYRDSGEMVSVAYTLGVAHPPGYPLYAMISKIFLIITPIGNFGYRMNVLSALFGALTVYLLYKILQKFSMKPLLAGAVSLIFGVSYLQWYLSIVSEMYTINTFFAALLMYLAVKYETEQKNKLDLKPLYFFVFLFAIGLGNRMDLLLFGSGLFLVYYAVVFTKLTSNVFVLPVLFTMGFSVFLFLPIRSGAGPILDWNHPADLSRFWGSLTRKTHGGTLDLISEGYARGENFYSTGMFYLKHLFEGTFYAGPIIALLGAVFAYRNKKALFWAVLTAWFLSAPFFIYKANMPPNPHALVILEAHFIMPNLAVAFFMGLGFLTLEKKYNKYLVYIFAMAILIGNICSHYPNLNKRKSYFAYDYASNILRSLPPDSVLIMKKDVQLFSLWVKKLVENKRKDVAFLSQGLSGSKWYQDKWGKYYGDVAIGPLRSSNDWNNIWMFNKNKKVYFSKDCDFPGVGSLKIEPAGLVSKLTEETKNPTAELLIENIYSYRGTYRYNAYKEFFVPDLIQDYSQGCFQLGQYNMEKYEYSKARKYFEMALYQNPLMPVSMSNISFSYYAENRFSESKDSYLKTVKLYSNYLQKAVEYNAQPALIENISKEYSDSLVSAGVSCEKLGQDDESIKYYTQAVEVSPNNAGAYFNRSVIYWKKGDWQQVVRDLENAVRIKPDYQEARYYLEKVKKSVVSRK